MKTEPIKLLLNYRQNKAKKKEYHTQQIFFSLLSRTLHLVALNIINFVFYTFNFTG
jgi:hypothetical protein